MKRLHGGGASMVKVPRFSFAAVRPRRGGEPKNRRGEVEKLLERRLRDADAGKRAQLIEELEEAIADYGAEVALGFGQPRASKVETRASLERLAGHVGDLERAATRLADLAKIHERTEIEARLGIDELESIQRMALEAAGSAAVFATDIERARGVLDDEKRKPGPHPHYPERSLAGRVAAIWLDANGGRLKSLARHRDEGPFGELLGMVGRMAASHSGRSVSGWGRLARDEYERRVAVTREARERPL